jgi:hypothetical protein
MKSIDLLVQIGTNLTAIKAHVTIFGLTDADQTQLSVFEMNNPSMSVKIEEDNYNYYYATVNVESFTSNWEDYTVDSNSPIQLLSIFEKEESQVKFNEYITVANAFCFTQSMLIDSSGSIVLYNTDRVLGLSLGMRRNFVSTKGEISPVISSSPNANETNSYALWMSLANLTYSSLTNSKIYRLFRDYTQTGALVPGTFLAALYNMIRNPFASVSKIYQLIENSPVTFRPSLTELSLPPGSKAQPDQWTLTIKKNDSGAGNYLIAGAAFIAFDKNDRGWLANNVVRGTPNSASYCMVFEPDGKPAEFSPVFGGGLVGVGFGVTVDNEGENIYFGSFGWGPTQCNPHHGGLAHFSNLGETLSPTNGYTKGLSRVQGLNFDADGNLWVTSWGSQEPLAPAPTIYPFEDQESALVVFLKDPQTGKLNFDEPISYPLDNPFRATFDVAYNPVSKAMYLACAGIENANDPAKSGISGVYKFRLVNGAIHLDDSWDINNPDAKNVAEFEGLRQVAFDSEGNVYVGAIKTGATRVVKLNSDLMYITEFTDKINRPWSVTIDSNDTIFAGNFGFELKNTPLGKQLPLGSTGVAVIKEDLNGNLVSQLMTLPTGGDEVKLANGFPLYGIIKTVDHGPAEGKTITHPCYSPLMRITSSTIDGAGNLWVMNNWKPSGAIDLLENPGGDGFVIFIGVAAPAPYAFG